MMKQGKRLRFYHQIRLTDEITTLDFTPATP
jgi:hypothetical protein